MGGGLAGLVAAGAPVLRQALAAPSARPKPRLDAAAAVRALVEGNGRYAANQPWQRDFSANRMALVQGQQPIAAILSCSDSRVTPELVFDQSPGDIFVTRVAGNFINTDGLASTEYAVELLGTPLVFVLGHSSCGAVGAAIKVMQDDVDLPGHLPELVQPLFRPVEETRRRNPPPADLLEAAIESNVRHQVTRFKSMSPLIGKYVASGEVQVVGGVYEIATGRVRMVT
jgi:carbonic anhydrase